MPRAGSMTKFAGPIVAVAAWVLAVSFVTGAGPAAANQCAAACYDQHNKCRIQTKGSASCDAALTQCLQGCNTKR